MELDLTKAQLMALAGAATYAAIELSAPNAGRPGVRAELKEAARALVVSSGIDPTELKDLGMDLAKRAVEMEN
jgi:hypothetical protein